MHFVHCRRVQSGGKLATVLFVALFLFSSHSYGQAPAATEALQHLLPLPDFAPGWKLDGDILLFDKSNVYEHINGEAELYFPYGFKALAAATYQFNADDQRTVAAELYLMGSLFDAFGIYSNYRYAEAEFLSIGAEGYANEYQLIFYQDRYFVKLSAYGEPQQNREDLLACARAIEKSLPPWPFPPYELMYLRATDIVPRTERYVAESLLGYDFFTRGLEAEARVGGNPARLFIVLEQSPPQAEAALKAYEKYLTEAGAKFEWKSTSAGGAVLAADDPLHKTIMLCREGRFILGVTGLKESGGETGLPLIRRLLTWLALSEN